MSCCTVWNFTPYLQRTQPKRVVRPLRRVLETLQRCSKSARVLVELLWPKTIVVCLRKLRRSLEHLLLRLKSQLLLKKPIPLLTSLITRFLKWFPMCIVALTIGNWAMMLVRFRLYVLRFLSQEAGSEPIVTVILMLRQKLVEKLPKNSARICLQN